MLNNYILKKEEKRKKAEEISNYIFGLVFGFSLIIIFSFRVLYKSVGIVSVVDFILIIYGMSGVIFATINPNLKPLRKMKQVNLFIFNFLGDILLKIVLMIIYFLFVVPVGIFMQKKDKNNHIHHQETNWIDYQPFVTKKLGKYRFLKIFRLFASEYFYMIPVVIFLLIISLLVLFITSSTFTPFIYTLF